MGKLIDTHRRLLKAIPIAIGTSLLSMAAHAQTYGQSSYNTVTYGGNGLVNIGPVTLPVTGPQLTALISAAILGSGVGLFIWLRQRRQERTSLK